MSGRNLEHIRMNASAFADGTRRETNLLFGVFCLIKLKLSMAGALKVEGKKKWEASQDGSFSVTFISALFAEPLAVVTMHHYIVCKISR